MLAPCAEITPVSLWSVPGRSTTSRRRAATRSADEDLDRRAQPRVDERVAVVERDLHRHLSDRTDAAGGRRALRLRLPGQVGHDADHRSAEVAVERVHLHLD